MVFKNNKYYEYFIFGFKNIREYKFQFIGLFIYPLLVVLLSIVIWRYIFLEKGTKLIGGFTYKEMIIYILITQLLLIKNLNLYFRNFFKQSYIY